ncbi:RDD family protein [Desulfococcaceae bacterium HSG7]|nr:RDD family protein [Desulfococcaceae bacterium HSG7]
MKTQNIGKMVLQGVNQGKEAQVIDYLAGLFKKASRDQIEALVQKAPVVLVKGIPEQQAQKIVVKLQELGGNAKFIPASSPDKSSSAASPASPDKISQPQAAPATSQTDSASETARQASSCSQCKQLHAQEDMLFYNDMWVCAACKSAFVQQIKESGKIDGQLNYAGFWIRFGAKSIDGIIMKVVSFLIATILALLLGMLNIEQATLIGSILSMLIEFIISAVYTTWFVGKFAATPGKMACGLKVVMYDGGRVSYGRALGRCFAEILSAIILLIGYIMAAFDDEKRTLHDRICNTRVVMK